jgi:hypothetical protein
MWSMLHEEAVRQMLDDKDAASFAATIDPRKVMLQAHQL